ncbi:DUF3047 domain-containing protein [Algiphilus sp. W345]|uniref:DUF3047 domain-containing protein n=1 Tax=Banduia mediterranea TaxID=3075609 RepID=A0ABU2WJT4_9GAMM|nr:DUF3047 domain-containing protein [Algiphilus sp. W345]MDT0497337.1 DUF3047 domain-containing protein [Algiphilus sp. W345]
MAGVITELAVAGRRFIDTRRRRRAGQIEPAPDCARFKLRMQALLDQAPAGLIAKARWIDMPANAAPWLDSGVQLEPNDVVSWFVCGRTWASKPLDVWVSPALQVWSRIGNDGDLISASRNSHSVTADRAGTLQFGNYFPNDWADKHGNTMNPDTVYRSLKGELLILVIRWQSDALTGLKALQQSGDVDGWLAREIERLELGPQRPSGWNQLWHIPDNEIYRACQTPDGAPAICCHTHGDVGIIQHDVDFPFVPSTQIDWRWIVETLPSTIREDAVLSHDYLSIAIEFDTGKDLTYYWSSTLPVETGYICPLPAWKDKEYHVVVRSGSDGLGEWHSESRNLYADYQRHMARSMGGSPQRIVRIWLIANSVFQRGTGDCSYAGIRLSDGERVLSVL